MTHRPAYDAAYYQANKERMRPQRRINQRRYYRRHRIAIKVAENLGVRVGEARMLLGEKQ